MTIERVSPDFFTGVEVENSPAKGMNTLFVVGIQPVETILEVSIRENIKHIYIGANMSLHGVKYDDFNEWLKWNQMIDKLLEFSHVEYVTVDIELSQVEGFLENRISENNRIIPMVSVKLPYTKLLNYNTTIKIDDKGFDQTNPGVWCHSLHKLMDRETFTPWTAYVGDNPVN